MIEDLMEWTADFLDKYAVFTLCITGITLVAVGVTRLVYG